MSIETDSILNAIFEDQKKAILDQLTAEIREHVSGEIISTEQDSERLGSVNVFLTYVKVNSEYFNYYYSMYVLNNEYGFDSQEALVFCNKNANSCKCYTIEDVKAMAKSYLNSVIRQL